MTQAGGCIGALFSGAISDKIGRRYVILWADVLFTLGAFLMWFAPDIQTLMVGRFIVGLGVGAASVIVPLYLSEISPDEVRGTVIAINLLFVTGAQFISSAISLMLGHNWRLMLGLAAIPSIAQFIGMLTMPESQRWLAKKGNNLSCKEVLTIVYQEHHVEDQY